MARTTPGQETDHAHCNTRTNFSHTRQQNIMSAAHRGLQPAAMKPVNSYNVNTLIALMSYKNCSSSRNNITGVNPMSPNPQKIGCKGAQCIGHS